ncbi:MAG: thiamine pyrophosphate-binding protein [Polyangiaceae bacterium]|nr:thiamine pyrophosphate-binding protein [Polyangiaceae bacterium]
MPPPRHLWSGNEAVAHAAFDHGIGLASGYPGTPSTEILEVLGALGGPARWAPNEKVALEVGLGATFGGARALVTMKHVGLNVAADVLFTAAYTGVNGGLVVVSADDPGMASSQNEQDNRRYAVAAGVPMLEPRDAQDAYDLWGLALEISERWRLPVLLRMTTRVCHSRSVVVPRPRELPTAAPSFDHDIASRVMVPANARRAHQRLRERLRGIAEWAETAPIAFEHRGDRSLGLVTAGVSAMHAREAAPTASSLELLLTHPLPLARVARFVAEVDRAIVVEEGDPCLFEQLRAAGIEVAGRPEPFRFGELSVPRIRQLLAGDLTPDPEPPRGKPPELCKGCPHRSVFGIFAKHDLIVAGDIGCYTLAALPPLNAMDTCVCMGASIGVGLGLRHVLPPEQARRVVSVIGDSTFVHSGLTGLAEMVYNPPATGHVVVVVDNGTTAMTGQQEHPGTGRTLTHEPTSRISFEAVATAMGVARIAVVDPCADEDGFERTLLDLLASETTAVLIARRACLLAARRVREAERSKNSCSAGGGNP